MKSHESPRFYPKIEFLGTFSPVNKFNVSDHELDPKLFDVSLIK